LFWFLGAEFGAAVQVGRDEADIHNATAIAEAGSNHSNATAVTCPQITEGLVRCAAEAGRSIAVIGSSTVVDVYTNGLRDLPSKKVELFLLPLAITSVEKI